MPVPSMNWHLKQCATISILSFSVSHWLLPNTQNSLSISTRSHDGSDQCREICGFHPIEDDHQRTATTTRFLVRHNRRAHYWSLFSSLVEFLCAHNTQTMFIGYMNTQQSKVTVECDTFRFLPIDFFDFSRRTFLNYSLINSSRSISMQSIWLRRMITNLLSFTIRE